MTKILKTIFFVSMPLAVMLIGSVAAPSSTGKKTRDDTETQNILTVREKVALCSRSGCKTCGSFSYDMNGLVLYSPSVCEMNTENQERQQQAADEDRQIRARYLTPGEGPEAGTADAGRRDAGK